MKTTGKIVIGALGLTTAALLIAGVKAKETYDTGMKLKFRFRDVSNLKFDTNSLTVMVKANLSLFLDNPTDVAFDVDGYGVARLKKVMVRDGLGNVIAIANVDIPALTIPAGGTIQIDNIPIEADGISALGNFQNFHNLTGINITGELEVLGNIVTF